MSPISEPSTSDVWFANFVSGREAEYRTEASNSYLVNLMEIYRTVPQIKAEYTFFSRAHEMFTRSDYVLGQKHKLIN